MKINEIYTTLLTKGTAAGWTAECAGELPSFLAKADSRQEEDFTEKLNALNRQHRENLKILKNTRKKMQADTEEFFPVMQEHAKALTSLGVDKEHLAIGLYSYGFITAMMVLENGMQRFPDSIVRASIASTVRERLAPEEKSNLEKVAEGMKRTTHLPAIPTEEEYAKNVKDQWEELKLQLIAAHGVTEEQAEKFLIDNHVTFPSYEEEKERIEGERNWKEAMKQLALEQDKWLDTLGVPDEKKAGTLFLFGYMTGTRVLQEQQTRQKQVLALSEAMLAATRARTRRPK